MARAFDAVYDEYGRAVRAYLGRLTGDAWVAEELTQETFFRYLAHRDALRNANGSLGSWLYRVATNLAFDRRRRRKTEPLEAEPPAAVPDAAECAETRDLGERVRAEVAALPEELRAAFLLRAHHELPYHDVAEAMGVTERAAKDRFRRARDLLARRLRPIFREDRP